MASRESSLSAIPRPRMSLISIKGHNKRLTDEISLAHDDNYKIVTDVYKEFANESTIHGVKYTAHSKTVFEKYSINLFNIIW